MRCQIRLNLGVKSLSIFAISFIILLILFAPYFFEKSQLMQKTIAELQKLIFTKTKLNWYFHLEKILCLRIRVSVVSAETECSLPSTSYLTRTEGSLRCLLAEATWQINEQNCITRIMVLSLNC